jgi:hypothetical protein
MANIVDDSAPYLIASAIRKVGKTPGLRVKPGMEVLWRLFEAPDHALPRTELSKQFQVDLHFGWLCRRIAELLGDPSPGKLALVDISTGRDGTDVLTLKPPVVAALMEFGKAAHQVA